MSPRLRIAIYHPAWTVSHVGERFEAVKRPTPTAVVVTVRPTLEELADRLDAMEPAS